ncbi:MAG: hypothetical protein WBG30_06580, partial [Psychrilyobacter sp.]|uniref:hypothetical protein n=1 Tax=Psychrilyobacter sp. TaxID=2586924 RepID=UPI003C72343D
DLVEGLVTKENIFNKNGAFNKSFGTTLGTVMEGNKRATDLGGEAAFTKKTAFNRSFSHVISSTSKVLVASAYAVKIAYDKGAAALSKAITAQNTANSAQIKANEAYSLASGKEPKFTKKDAFNRSFSHVVTSTSKVLVASAYAVKTAYDKGLVATRLTNTNKSAIKNNAEQIKNFMTVSEFNTGLNDEGICQTYDNGVMILAGVCATKARINFPFNFVGEYSVTATCSGAQHDKVVVSDDRDSSSVTIHNNAGTITTANFMVIGKWKQI